jgi:hypothetical protein
MSAVLASFDCKNKIILIHEYKLLHNTKRTAKRESSNFHFLVTRNYFHNIVFISFSSQLLMHDEVFNFVQFSYHFMQTQSVTMKKVVRLENKNGIGGWECMQKDVNVSLKTFSCATSNAQCVILSTLILHHN